jgi:hypothetical protein
MAASHFPLTNRSALLWCLLAAPSNCDKCHHKASCQPSLFPALFGHLLEIIHWLGNNLWFHVSGEETIATFECALVTVCFVRFAFCQSLDHEKQCHIKLSTYLAHIISFVLSWCCE